MSEENNTQDTLRETIENSFNEIEAAPENQPEVSQPSRNRDEQGRFAPKAAEAVESEQPPAIETPAPAEPARPKGWKKDFIPAWEKMSRGEALTPDEAKAIAGYAVQRENEFATGVSTYKTEAEQVRKWNEAVAPMIQRLQQHGVDPASYVKQLVGADQLLTHGTTDQKIQALGQLAQSYGIPLSVLAQGQQGSVNPIVDDLLSQIQSQRDEIAQIKAWRSQQESSSIESLVNDFKSSDKAPHFEAVRGHMAQLLEAGLAKDLEDAYEQAVFINRETRELELARQREAQSNIDAVNKAKKASVSVRSSSPRGNAAGGTADPSDLRATLEAAFDNGRF